MKKKYWVPSIEKANEVITLIANEPNLKLMEISSKTGINKSSLFSILSTLEQLNWIYKKNEQTYALGMKLGYISSQFDQQFDLTELFEQETEASMEVVNETIQMSILEGKDIIYIAKKVSPQPIRVVSDPGMRLPAHATAMGKALLSQFNPEELNEMYADTLFEKLTDNTVESLEELAEQIRTLKKDGFIVEKEETLSGFICIAAPIMDGSNRVIAAVSITMTADNWKDKKDLCKREIKLLSNKLSVNF